MYQFFLQFNSSLNLQLGMLVTDDVSLVGESDGTGFGVGTAPKLARAEPSAVVTLKKKEKERERKKTAQRGPR